MSVELSVAAKTFLQRSSRIRNHTVGSIFSDFLKIERFKKFSDQVIDRLAGVRMKPSSDKKLFFSKLKQFVAIIYSSSEKIKTIG
jgi:hypothetical protein